MTARAPFEPGYPRDIAGYGAKPPHPRWPGDREAEMRECLAQIARITRYRLDAMITK